MTERLYIVVRNDLPQGLQLAQACHATREFSLLHPRENVGDNLIVLHASRVELERLVVEVSRDCTVVAFYEPDLEGALTAAAFGIGARKRLSALPLALRAA